MILARFAPGYNSQTEKNGNTIYFWVNNITFSFAFAFAFANELSMLSAMIHFAHILTQKNTNFITAKNPVPVRCPVAGKFNFTQRGEHPFKTRYANYSHMQNESEVFANRPEIKASG